MLERTELQRRKRNGLFRLGSVLASLLFTRCSELIDSGATPGFDVERVRELALKSIPRPSATENSLRFSDWAVGVTTSPRPRPTLDLCLDKHIGDVSTLWPAGRAWLKRKAGRFAGDSVDPDR